MKEILDFAINNYIICIVISVLLLLSLIGYSVNAIRQKDVKIKNAVQNDTPKQEEKIDNLNN